MNEKVHGLGDTKKNEKVCCLGEIKKMKKYVYTTEYLFVNAQLMVEVVMCFFFII